MSGRAGDSAAFLLLRAFSAGEHWFGRCVTIREEQRQVNPAEQRHIHHGYHLLVQHTAVMSSLLTELNSIKVFICVAHKIQRKKRIFLGIQHILVV